MSATLRQRLKDSQYRDAHLCAAFVVKEQERLTWYDSAFLRRFEAARQFLELHSPAELPRFLEAFEALKPPADFQPIANSDLFPEAQRDEIKRTVAGLKTESLETHELSAFGRHVVHDHPFFIALQQELNGKVGELLGQEVTPGYNFLSLYGSEGRCAPHMDQPISMYTLDYCIEQDVDWPIHISPVVDWPSAAEGLKSGEAVLADPLISFSPHEIAPGDALLFCGSSQWHYRDAMPDGGRSHLLFFHYFPKGCDDLVRPARWPEHFGVPQLQALLDLFDDPLVYDG